MADQRAISLVKTPRLVRLAAPFCVFGFLVLIPGRPSNQTYSRSDERQREELDRGEYLVQHVAMCVICHTPRDDAGQMSKNELFSGAPIPVANPFHPQPWASYAPRIAGLPGWEEADVIELLRTGQSRDGFRPRPPMPSFRLKQDDAIAVARYLKSLQ